MAAPMDEERARLQVLRYRFWAEKFYPPVNIQRAIENGHRSSGFSH